MLMGGLEMSCGEAGSRTVLRPNSEETLDVFALVALAAASSASGVARLGVNFCSGSECIFHGNLNAYGAMH